MFPSQLLEALVRIILHCRDRVVRNSVILSNLKFLLLATTTAKSIPKSTPEGGATPKPSGAKRGGPTAKSRRRGPKRWGGRTKRSSTERGAPHSGVHTG